MKLAASLCLIVISALVSDVSAKKKGTSLSHPVVILPGFGDNKTKILVDGQKSLDKYIEIIDVEERDSLVKEFPSTSSYMHQKKVQRLPLQEKQPKKEAPLKKKKKGHPKKKVTFHLSDSQ